MLHYLSIYMYLLIMDALLQLSRHKLVNECGSIHVRHLSSMSNLIKYVDIRIITLVIPCLIAWLSSKNLAADELAYSEFLNASCRILLNC
jgi:hypothetical protein